MKVAFVTQPWDLIVPDVGGPSSIPILSYQLAQQLTGLGNQVVIYGKRSPGQKRAEKDENGVLYRRISLQQEDWVFKPVKFLERRGLSTPRRPFFAAGWYYAGYAFQVARDIRKKRYDIAHVHNFSQFVPIIRALNPDIKIVLHMHCEWLTQLDRLMIKKRLLQSDLILGCSDYITEKIRQDFPQYAERCLTLFNGVEMHESPRQTEPNKRPDGSSAKRLLYIGRVSPEKGIHVLLAAFQEIATQLPQVDLDIVGPVGPVPYEFVIPLSDDELVKKLAPFYRNTSYLEQLENSLPADIIERVHFHGFVPHTQLMDYYRAADVFIFPSVWNEPFGMPIVEAMMHGVPVVATRSGGIPEILKSGEMGVLVERDDPFALSQALLRLLQDDYLRKTIGQAARRSLPDRFRWSVISSQLLAAYESLND